MYLGRNQGTLQHLPDVHPDEKLFHSIAFYEIMKEPYDHVGKTFLLLHRIVDVSRNERFQLIKVVFLSLFAL